MKARFTGIHVAAITAALPSRSLAMLDLAQQFGELDVKRIIHSTGIESVRIAGNLRTSDLCAAAARHLLTATNIDSATIDAIVVVTQTPDDLMPGVAVQLQHRLQLPITSVAFDINYGCSGFIYGLYQAFMLIKAGGCKRVLLCTGDTTSKLLHPDDRHVRMVFGDGASASLIETGDGDCDIVIRSDGSGRRHLHTPTHYMDSPTSSGEIGFLYMNGAEIMNFALDGIPQLINELLDFCNLKKSDISLLALHQANGFMLNYLRKLIGLSKELVPINVKNFGNVGPSSIPLLLTSSSQQLTTQKDNTILCGFGIGLSLAAAKLNLSHTKLIPPVDVHDDIEKISTTVSAI